MSHSSNKIYITSPYGVSIADIQSVIGSDRNDIGGLITTGTINKWAKWKPVRSTLWDLPTQESRKGAGRPTPNDYSHQYGVYAPGAGNVTTLGSIHDCRFIYERPEDGYNYKYRFLDFVDPENTGYGYRSDAHTDLFGSIFPPTGRIVVPTNDIGMELQITYTPLTTEEAKEMISIKDFLTNEAGQGTTIDPLSCYPCALITQGGYHYIRGLYKQNGTAIATIGSTGSQMWRLDTRNAPSWSVGQPATMSLFLCSQQIILHGSPNLDIANWITIAEEDEGGGTSAWEAWFSPIPDASGKTVFIGAAPSSADINITGASYSLDRSTLVVTWEVSGEAIPGNYTLTADMGGDSPTKILRVTSSTVTGSTSFTVATDFPSTLFIRGSVNTYDLTVTNNSTTPPTVIDAEQYTLTY